MNIDKSLITGSTTMLVLKLLEEKDMYGYEMIETLSAKSNNTFSLKAGTLYPILHGLEKKGILISYEENADNSRIRKYYHITDKGKKLLVHKTTEWNIYSKAVNQVLGGVNFGTI